MTSESKLFSLDSLVNVTLELPTEVYSKTIELRASDASPDNKGSLNDLRMNGDGIYYLRFGFKDGSHYKLVYDVIWLAIGRAVAYDFYVKTSEKKYLDVVSNINFLLDKKLLPEFDPIYKEGSKKLYEMWGSKVPVGIDAPEEILTTYATELIKGLPRTDPIHELADQALDALERAIKTSSSLKRGSFAEIDAFNEHFKAARELYSQLGRELDQTNYSSQYLTQDISGNKMVITDKKVTTYGGLRLQAHLVNDFLIGLQHTYDSIYRSSPQDLNALRNEAFVNTKSKKEEDGYLYSAFRFIKFSQELGSQKNFDELKNLLSQFHYKILV